MIVRSRAPVRIEFGGGGTDYPEYFKDETGYVLNATINKYIYGTLKPKHTNDVEVLNIGFKRSKLYWGNKNNSYTDIETINSNMNEDKEIIQKIIDNMNINYGMDIFLRSDLPPNTGLGTAATVAVTIIGLFNHLRYEKCMDRFELAELAYKINNLGDKIPGGKQCQYASSFGGLNFLEFNKEHTKVHPLNVKRSTLLELEKNLILVYVGNRESFEGVKNIITNQQLSYNDPAKLNSLHELKNLAIDMKHTLLRNDLVTFGENLGRAWELKKRLNPSITNQKIDDIYNLAINSGALGGRIIGAGGGGHMLFYCESNKEQKIAAKLEEAGVGVIDFSFTDNGLETWEANQ